MNRLDPMVDLMDQAPNLEKEEVGDTRQAADHGGLPVPEKTNKLDEAVTITINNTGKGVASNRSLGMGRTHITTYADTLNSWLPAAHLNRLTKTQIRARQVLIDKGLAVDTNQGQELTEQELVCKANEALTRMDTHLGHSLSDPKAIGAKKLHNGGVVLELSSLEVA